MSNEEQIKKETSGKGEVNPETVKGANENANENASKETKPNENANPKATENVDKGKDEKPKEVKGPTPAEVSKKLKKEKVEAKEKADKKAKKAQGIEKSAIFSKQYPAFMFPGDNATAQKELAQEAGLQLLADGKWETASYKLDNGAVIYYIKKGK